jgi:lipid-binding SYLF domain-containing protein
MVKDAAGKWSAPSFVKANEASLGFQVGGEQHFVVVLFMTTNAVNMLGDQKFDFSGEARGTAGNESSGVQTTSPTAPAVLVYDDRQGLYAGAAVKGGATTCDQDANRTYYGDYFTARDILFNHKGQPTSAATELAQKIDAWAHPSQTGADRAER